MVPRLRFTIYNETLASNELLINSEFTTNLLGWNVGAGDGAWSYNAGKARATLSSATVTTTDPLRQPLTFQGFGLHRVKYSIELSAIDPDVTDVDITFHFYKAGVLIDSFTYPLSVSVGVQTGEISVRANRYTEIGMSVSISPALGTSITIDADYLRVRCGTEVTQPAGWKESNLVLERNKIYHSLVEYFQGDFVWINGTRNNFTSTFYNARTFDLLQTIEAAQGPAAKVELFVDVSFKTNFYESVLLSLIDISQKNTVSKGGREYRAIAPIIRADFWSKMINRKATPVDLSVAVDLDGNTREAISKIVLPLPSQKIHQDTNLFTQTPALLGILWDASFSSPDFQKDIDDNDYVQFGFPDPILNEVETNHSLASAPTGSAKPVNLYTIKYSGVYTFDIQLALTVAYFLNLGSYQEYIDLKGLSSFDPSGALSIKIYIQINGATPIEFTVTDHAIASSGTGSSANDYWTEYNYADTLNLNAGDQIRIYGRKVTSGAYGYGNNGVTQTVDQVHQLGLDSANTIQFSGGIPTLQFNGVTESYLKISADTTFNDTETDAFTLRDAFESILSKIIGADNVLVSDFLESCKGRYAITRGKNYRGYPFSEKALALSLDDLWQGADPCLFLGLGYLQVNGVDKIEIRDKADFYDKDPVIFLANVGAAQRSYDLSRIYKSIQLGFAKWSAESGSGIDDPQTKRSYSSQLGTIGEDISVLSKFIGASLAQERTRRNRVELGKDDRLDEEIFIISLILDASAPDGYSPEFDENFAAITGLLNSDARQNIRLACAHIFKRWLKLFSSGIAFDPAQEFKFQSGEGNYSMTTQLNPDDCEATDDPDPVLAENGNFAQSDDPLLIPQILKFKYPLTWEQYKLIRDNRKKAIGISATTENYLPYHIDKLDFNLTSGFANFTVVLGGKDVIYPDLFDFTFDFTFE